MRYSFQLSQITRESRTYTRIATSIYRPAQEFPKELSTYDLRYFD